MSLQRIAVGAYARLVADKIGLRDWSIHVLDESPRPGDAADMRGVYGRRVAEIRISDEALAGEPEKLRYYVVHELVHCHFASMHNYLDLILNAGEQVAYGQCYEYGVDAAASALAPHMPLPKRGREVGVNMSLIRPWQSNRDRGSRAPDDGGGQPRHAAAQPRRQGRAPHAARRVRAIPRSAGSR